MHTFRPSRGRLIFDVFCALGIAACFVGGWVQTGAWALLPAAAIAALYSVVRALAARRPAAVAVVSAPELKSTDKQPNPANAVKNMEPVEAEAAPTKKARKAKAPRKARGRGKAIEEKITEPVLFEEEDVVLGAGLEEDEVTLAEFPEEVAQIPLTPLFEPEPFVRQQRAVFGRKAG